MQWYSYSTNSDFDKLRSVGHRYDGDYGGFEYEYCFAEYEYRFAEYDANRKTKPLERLFSFRTLCGSQNANCECPPTSSPDLFSSPVRRRGVTTGWGSAPSIAQTGSRFSLCLLVFA